MWCCRCQQDVPTARGASGPPQCARCGTALKLPDHSAVAIAHPADVGIALEAFDRPLTPATPSLGEVLGASQSDADLRRISRLLRPAIRWDAAERHDFHLHQRPDAKRSTALRDERLNRPRKAKPSRTPPPQTKPAWGISLLLAVGGATLAIGLAMLASASTGARPAVWQAGISATVAGQGLLLIGVASMAARLWRNSRRLNRQLAGVDRKLDDLQLAAGQLVHARLTSSQEYYQHFGAAMRSPSLEARG
jgi:hypothetical protein